MVVALKIVTLEMLMGIREKLRHDGKRVVWTNGCFDLIHVGHLRSLRAAKSVGDILVVGINDDRSIRQLKGEGHPLMAEHDRCELLAGFECVDYVVLFSESTPVDILRRVQPDIHCKGADYEPPHGKSIPELEVVESYGGQVRFLPMIEGRSTSALVGAIQALSSNTEE